MPTSKKNLPKTVPLVVIIGALVLLLALFGIAVVLRSSTTKERSIKPEAREVVEERYEQVRFAQDAPYLLIRPTLDMRNIELTIARINDVKQLNLTFAYTSKGVEQGVVERIDMQEGATSAAKRIYLGSCSESTGIRRCYDHTNVSQGFVSAVFDKRRDERNQEIKQEFKVTALAQGQTTISSLDENVTITLKKSMSTNPVIVASLTGLPLPIEGHHVLGQPYSFLAAKEVNLSGSIEFSLPPAVRAHKALLFSWNDRKKLWEPLTTTQDGTTLKAHVTSLTIFAAAVTAE